MAAFNPAPRMVPGLKHAILNVCKPQRDKPDEQAEDVQKQCVMTSRLGGQRVTSSELSTLQEDASRVRNVCILAHVDHGKTT